MNDDIIFEDKFIWHNHKNKLNKQKHKISFEAATDVFYDPFAIVGYDFANSTEQEDRFKTTGIISSRAVFITVSFTPRGELIRIFSARKADEIEKEEYYENTRRNLG